MQTPVYTIASNAGVEGAVIVGKLLESDDPDLGYDAAKGLTVYKHFLLALGLDLVISLYTQLCLVLYFSGEYVDMVKSGIIDPVKVIRTALVDAARYTTFETLQSHFEFIAVVFLF